MKEWTVTLHYCCGGGTQLLDVMANTMQEAVQEAWEISKNANLGRGRKIASTSVRQKPTTKKEEMK